MCIGLSSPATLQQKEAEAQSRAGFVREAPGWEVAESDLLSQGQDSRSLTVSQAIF